MLTTESGVRFNLDNEIKKATKVRDELRILLATKLFPNGGAATINDQINRLNSLADDLTRINEDQL